MRIIFVVVVVVVLMDVGNTSLGLFHFILFLTGIILRIAHQLKRYENSKTSFRCNVIALKKGFEAVLKLRYVILDGRVLTILGRQYVMYTLV